MTLITVFLQMLSLLIMIGAGWVATRREMLDEYINSKMSNLIVNLFNPFLVVSVAIGSAGQIALSELGAVALVAVGMFLLFIFIGSFLSPLFDHDPHQRSLFQLMFVFSNLGFIGIPVVTNLLGTEYVVFVTEFLIVYNLVFYTYGVTLMEGKFSFDSLKAMVNPGNLMTLVAIVIVVTGFQMPGFLTTAITYLGNVASPMALVLVGYSLAKSNFREIFTEKRLYLFCAIKLLLLPVLVLPLLRLLPIDSTLVPVCLLMFGMPCGNLPLILGTQKGIDCTMCSSGIIMSTLLCVVSVPILMALV